MKDFPLIKSLESTIHQKTTDLPTNIKYEKFKIMVENEETVVFIPKRESKHFSEKIQTINELSIIEYKSLLRKFRGIRG